uniref:C-type lectin domain-containing protein n=1 Tax=Anser cygnoides TaxID=8845 RepID=A0A8B9DF63_ANSCY
APPPPAPALRLLVTPPAPSSCCPACPGPRDTRGPPQLFASPQGWSTHERGKVLGAAPKSSGSAPASDGGGGAEHPWVPCSGGTGLGGAGPDPPSPSSVCHAGVQANKCPKGWLDFRGSCYGYFGQQLTWRKAEAWCKVIHAGCHLASLHSPEEHTAVARFVAKFQRSEEEDNVWIGLHYWNQAQVWIDGSKKRYSAWDDDEFPKGKYCTV